MLEERRGREHRADAVHQEERAEDVERGGERAVERGADEPRSTGTIAIRATTRTQSRGGRGVDPGRRHAGQHQGRGDRAASTPRPPRPRSGRRRPTRRAARRPRQSAATSSKKTTAWSGMRVACSPGHLAHHRLLGHEHVAPRRGRLAHRPLPQHRAPERRAVALAEAPDAVGPHLRDPRRAPRRTRRCSSGEPVLRGEQRGEACLDPGARRVEARSPPRRSGRARPWAPPRPRPPRASAASSRARLASRPRSCSMRVVHWVTVSFQLRSRARRRIPPRADLFEHRQRRVGLEARGGLRRAAREARR